MSGRQSRGDAGAAAWQRVLRQASLHALAALAVVWPLEVYQLLPLDLLFPGEAPLNLVSLLTLLLLPGAVLELLSARRWPVVWELTWPCLALLLLSALDFLTHGDSSLTALPVLILAALLLVHSRDQAVRLLWLSASSCALVAGFTLAVMAFALPTSGVQLFPLFPAAYSAGGEIALPFAFRLESGALTLCLGLACALAAATGMSQRLHKVLALFAALVIAAALLALAVPALALLPRWSPPDFLALGPVRLLALAAALWLCARVIAKLHGVPGQGRAERLLAGCLFAAVLLALMLPVAPWTGHAVPLALAAACVLKPASVNIPPPILLPRLLLPVALVALNAWQVSPAPGPDPRNYDARARVLMARGLHDTVLREMALVAHFAPGEARAALWRAEALLAQGEAEAGADAFAEAVGGSARVLPPPGEALEDFLNHLRDHVSAQSAEARGLAYERALAAAGRPVQALSVLRLRLPGALAEVDSDPAPLRAALAALLNIPEDTPELQEWTAAELQALLDTL